LAQRAGNLTQRDFAATAGGNRSNFPSMIGQLRNKSRVGFLTCLSKMKNRVKMNEQVAFKGNIRGLVS
jgi:hypothetical protein